MPYCDDCHKYWTPSSMSEDGTCPRCGTLLEPADADVVGGEPGDDPAEDGADDTAGDEKVPWHFKLMIVALVIYLVYRFVEIGIKIFT